MTDLTLAQLPEHYGQPLERTLAKSLPFIDKYAARFITRSPFCVLASVGADGTVEPS